MSLLKVARKVGASYDSKLPDSAIATVNNGDLRELSEALAAMDAVAEKWEGFDYPGSEVAPRGSL